MAAAAAAPAVNGARAAGASTAPRSASNPKAALALAARSVHGMGLVPGPTAGAAPRASRALNPVGAPLPRKVDLTAWTMPVGDQGQVGSCVTWAIDYAMMGWYSRHDAKAGAPFAPMFTYSQVAERRGGDFGATFDEVFTRAKKAGSETQARYPQGDFDYITQPTPVEKYDAQNYRISGWNTLVSWANGGDATMRAIKTALAHAQPVAVGIPVRDGFEFLGSDATAVDNDTTSQIWGRHAVLAVGYDASGVLIQNSWGTAWGNQGFGRLSWNVIKKDVFEAHTMNGFAVPTVQRGGQRTQFLSAAAKRHLTFGKAGAVPLSGDWNGDGIDTPGVFTNGTFRLRNQNTSGAPDINIPLGQFGDIPVVGDWDGDGTDTVGIVRGNTWYLRNSNTPGEADTAFEYGEPGDIPVVGDWNGDRIDTVGVVHGSTWELRNTNAAGTPDLTFGFGQPGGARVVGDWNGDGIDTPATVRGAGWRFRNSNTSGPAQSTASYGDPRDVPLAGRYLTTSLRDRASVTH